MTAMSPVSPVSPTSSVSDRGDWSVAVWSPCVEGMDCATKYGIWYPAGYDISLPPISTQWHPVANLNPWLAPMIPRERRGRFMIDSMQLLPVDPYSCPSRIYRAVHAGHQSRGLRPRGDIRPNYWNFHLYIEKLFDPKVSLLSPFLSLTSDFRRAESICKAWHKQGYKNVRILELDLHAWATSTRKPIWRASDVVTALGLPWDDSYSNEYIVADGIDGARVFSSWE